MTGAMYSAISGLKTHMSALNVIGNNISNVNTVGYKATRYTFSEALYTTSHAGSNGTPVLGGINPAQIGYGCSVGTIDLNMSTASYSPTGQALDCMIDGDGFFLVGDKTKYVTTQTQLNGMDLTRVGNFDFKSGWLVDGDGNVVYGFLRCDDTNGAVSGNPNNTSGTATSSVLAGIRLPITYSYSVVDDEGNVTERTDIYWPEQRSTGEGDDISYSLSNGLHNGVSITADEDGNLYQGEPGTDNRIYDVDSDTWANGWGRMEADTISIDATGRVVSVTEDGSYVVGTIAIGKVDSPNGVTHVDGRYYQALGGAGDLHLTTVGGSYTDATMTVSELVIKSAGDTEIVTGGLESSNTDLATEISNMIVIQRGYQANTRIVTVTDSMLEELVNMKR